MPRYDYVCAQCGRRFEVMHGVHEDGPSACPLCGGGPVRKAISAPAVHFRGTGWAKKERHAATSRGSGSKDADGSDERTPVTANTSDTGTSTSDAAPADKAPSASSAGGSASTGASSAGASSTDKRSKGSSTTGSSGDPAPARTADGARASRD